MGNTNSSQLRDAIKQAESKGYSEAEIREFMKKQGYSDAEINEAFSPAADNLQDVFSNIKKESSEAPAPKPASAPAPAPASRPAHSSSGGGSGMKILGIIIVIAIIGVVAFVLMSGSGAPPTSTPITSPQSNNTPNQPVIVTPPAPEPKSDLIINITDVHGAFWLDDEDDPYTLSDIDFYYETGEAISSYDTEVSIELQDNNGRFLTEERTRLPSLSVGKGYDKLEPSLRSSYVGNATVIIKIFVDSQLVKEYRGEINMGAYKGTEPMASVDVEMLEYKLWMNGVSLYDEKESKVWVGGKFRLENTGNYPLLIYVKRVLIVNGQIDAEYTGKQFHLLTEEPDNVHIFGNNLDKSNNNWGRSTRGSTGIVKVSVYDATDDSLITEKEFPYTIKCEDSYCNKF